jgi:hypothetical protein
MVWSRAVRHICCGSNMVLHLEACIVGTMHVWLNGYGAFKLSNSL